MTKKVELPEFVRLSHYRINLIAINSQISEECAEQQGSFHSRSMRIYLDEDIILRGGADALNVVIHEMLHVGYYQYLLKEKEEETVVNSYGNFITELLTRSELKAWIIDNM